MASPSRSRWPGLGVVTLVAGLVSGCGEGVAPGPQPTLAFFSAQGTPYRQGATRRLDLFADVSNPTAFELRGVHLEVQLVDGPGVTLELGTLPARGEGHAWVPVKLSRPLDARDFLGAPAEVVRPEGFGALPELWLVTRIEAATLGYQLDGKARREPVTRQINGSLAGWNKAETQAARTWRARSARRRLELFRSLDSGDLTTDVEDL